MLLALLIYGYAVGERSSRQIQRLCATDVAFRVICAQDVPDHTTIARFRKMHIERFDEVFAQVLALCARAGMVRLATVAIDGTKIAANASIDASHDLEWFRRQAERITAEAEEVDAAEDAELGVGVRGDELPAELADPVTRADRIRRCLAELAAEQTTREAEQAEQAAKAERHLAKTAAEPVPGRPPAGVDRLAAAQARLHRELAARQLEITDYDTRRAAAQAAGGPLPKGRRVADPEGGKRVKKARAALQRARAAAENATATKPSKNNNSQNSHNGKDADTPPQRNVTDPDSRIMPTRRGGWIQGLNAQFAVSADHVITAVGLTNNPSDTGEFTPMLERVQATADWLNTHRAIPEHIGTALFDAGYFSDDNLTAEGPDRLIAPGKSRQTQREAATNPASGPPPTDATPAEAMRHRLRTLEGAELYKKRGATVEPVNGIVKDRHRLRRFNLRGLKNCLGELTLTAAAHNLHRLFTTLHTAT